MQNRIFNHFIFVILFAIAQMSIAIHSVEHIEVHAAPASHDDSTQQHTSADDLCIHCVAQSHAHFANIQGAFIWPLLESAQYFSIDYVAKLTFDLAKYFSARAPPYFL